MSLLIILALTCVCYIVMMDDFTTGYSSSRQDVLLCYGRFLQWGYILCQMLSQNGRWIARSS